MASPTPTPPSSLFSATTTATTTATATIIDSICIGSGRFLRTVLVPALVAANYHPAIIQTRGRTFLDYCWKDAPNADAEHGTWTYEIDTVHFDGRIETTSVPCWGAGTLGSPEGKKDVLELCSRLGNGNGNGEGNGEDSGESNGNGEGSGEDKDPGPLIVGVGVTEAGLSNASTKAMEDLYDVLRTLSKCQLKPNQKICVINTDNVSQNGDKLHKFMNKLALSDETKTMRKFLAERVVFHNTMVDRITDQRKGPDSDSNGLVPRAEPTPLKALVIEDLRNDLPVEFSRQTLRKEHGVVVRRQPGQLNTDIALKLRIANGTHTALAHTMALNGMVMTDILSSPYDDDDDAKTAALLMRYLDSFFEHQILKGVEATYEFKASSSDARAVYDDWRRRLVHAHFGLNTFFITQNGAAKGGIRIGPTVRDLILSQETALAGKEDTAAKPAATPITCSTVFALAAILQFFTGRESGDSKPPKKTPKGTAPYRAAWLGRLDPRRKKREAVGQKEFPGCSEPFVVNMPSVDYGDGLYYRLSLDYTFRCDCKIKLWEGASTEIFLPKALMSIARSKQSIDYEGVVRAYLCKTDGGDLSSVAHTRAFGMVTKAVSVLLARMQSGDGMLRILGELDLEASCDCLVVGGESGSASAESSQSSKRQKS